MALLAQQDNLECREPQGRLALEAHRGLVDRQARVADRDSVA